MEVTSLTSCTLVQDLGGFTGDHGADRGGEWGGCAHGHSPALPEGTGAELASQERRTFHIPEQLLPRVCRPESVRDAGAGGQRCGVVGKAAVCNASIPYMGASPSPGCSSFPSSSLLTA